LLLLRETVTEAHARMAEDAIKRGKSHNLTEGNITPALIWLTLPLLAGNIIQQFYNTVDMVIVGKFVGDNAFGAIGICGSVFNLFTCILIGLNMGFAILYANHYGAGDYSAFKKTVFATVIIGVTVAVFLSLGGIIFLEPILRAIRTPLEMMAECRVYLFWVFLGLIFAFAYNNFAAMLRAIGKTDITFWVLVLSMFVNILLDYVLVAICGLAVLGAAIATVAAQAISALACLYYLLRYHPELRLTRKDMVFSKWFYHRAISFGSVSALQQSTVYFGKLLIQGAINTMGAMAIQGYTAAVCIESLLISFGDSSSAALSVFIAQNCGAGDKNRVQQGRRKGLFLIGCVGMVLLLCILLFRDMVLRLLLSQENQGALEAASSYLFLMGFFLILAGIVNVWQGYYRGIGRVRLTFLFSVIQITVRVALTYLLVPHYELLGVAIACGAGWGAMLMAHRLCFFYLQRQEREPAV
jgi:putative MATE family efflux protein